jgi:saccharopine dehydrogenase-like NADP-dependent oxidoreductase
MNVLILGGCADMAVPMNRWLKADRDVESVTLADLNKAKAERLAAELGPKFKAAFVDAEDRKLVVRLMKGHEVAVSYIGPFYHFEEPMVRCALEAGVDYVSICDDYDAYLRVAALDGEARKAGVKILTGFGNSPGLTQILARKGYNQLGGAERINVSWCAGSDEAAGPSNLAHLLYILQGTTLQTFDGKEREVKTGGGKAIVEFPEPIGRAAVYFTGHAESVSLPRNLSGLKEVTLRGGVVPNLVVTLIKAMSALGMTNTHKKRLRLASFFHKIEGAFAQGGMDKSVGRIDVYGRDGRYKYFTYVGHIAELTSAPAYLAAKWLRSRRLEGKPGGVYSGERLLDDPDLFLAELRAMGLAIAEDALAVDAGK